jgi:2-methylfumaryl-CoA isomerase
VTAPLGNLRVVEMSAFVAAPLGGMTLAQLGADVIRIDPIGGNIDYRRWPVDALGHSLYWAGLNKSKRSIALALHTAEGRQIARALITAPGPDAGILLTNLPAADWSDYASLSASRSDLIVMRLTANFDGGNAVDYTVNCASGFPLITGGTPEPINHVLPASDISAGLYLATGLLAAERHRTRTGEGQEIRIALSDVMLATVGNLGYLSDFELHQRQREPIGNALYGAFGGDFETSDGRRVMIVALTSRQWRNIVDATGLSMQADTIARDGGLDLDDEGDRFRARSAICAMLSPWVAARSLAEVRVIFERHRVLWGPYQDIQQLMTEDVRCSLTNPLFQRVEQPDIGTHLMPGSPLSFGAFPRPDVNPAPRLGQHTDELLRDVVGCSDIEIRRLRDAAIVA